MSKKHRIFPQKHSREFSEQEELDLMTSGSPGARHPGESIGEGIRETNVNRDTLPPLLYASLCSCSEMRVGSPSSPGL